MTCRSLSDARKNLTRAGIIPALVGLPDLKVVLNRAFDNASIEVRVEGGVQSLNKAEYIYKWSLPSTWLKIFEEMAESVSTSFTPDGVS